MRRFLGNLEVANELGWSRQRVHVNYKRGNLPKPYAYVGKKPVWKPETIEAFKNALELQEKEDLQNGES